jgi:hypothetical protein
MRKLLACAVLGALVVTVPASAIAQRRAAAETGPKHELGVDLAFQYVSLGSSGGSGLQLAAPVDVRVGFLSRSPNMFEIRASLAWDGNGGFVAFAPGLNVLHVLKRGSGTRGLMRAPYVTGGVGLNILKFGSGTSTETQFALGGGVGKRVPYGSAVFRPEGFLTYTFASGALPSAFSLGVRVGLSFWR